MCKQHVTVVTDGGEAGLNYSMTSFRHFESRYICIVVI